MLDTGWTTGSVIYFIKIVKLGKLVSRNIYTLVIFTHVQQNTMLRAFVLLLLTSPCWCLVTVVQCPTGAPAKAVSLAFTPEEYVSTFRQVFVMSDGSIPTATIDADSHPLLSDTMKHILSVLGDVGVYTSTDGGSIVVCETQLLRLAMLAALGNFVTNPSDTDVRQAGSLATVVLDAYTGRLIITTPYSALRSYFLETLLVVSIITIARLAMVRTVEVHSAL